MNPDPQADERFLRAVAERVSRAVKGARRDEMGRVTGMGADGTVTKHVDVVAENEILAAVEESKIPLNVLSEECGFVDHGAPRTLVVDPVDGTTNATRGLPMYCVSLAIGERRLSDVSVGLVQNIPTGDVYVAHRGGGAFRNGERLKPARFLAAEAIISPELGIHAKGEALYLASQKYYVRSLGSAALEMCFVAEGALDLYYMAQEKLRVVDIAASTLIVREAGGRVYTRDREPLDMDLSLKPRTSVVAVGSDAALEALEVFT